MQNTTPIGGTVAEISVQRQKKQKAGLISEKSHTYVVFVDKNTADDTSDQTHTSVAFAG